MQPSIYQQAIFDWFPNPTSQHLVVQAVAGSGKSWTIRESLRLPALVGKRIRVVAFNKHIATEMQAKVPPHVQAVTMHSFCLNEVIKRAWTHRVQIKESKVEDVLKWDVVGFKTASDDVKKEFWKARYSITKVIGLLKAHCKQEIDSVIVADLCEKHGIEIPVLKTAEWSHWLSRTWEVSNAMTRVIDFDDMIFYPIFYDMEVPKCDFVFVDEAQDLNPVQIEVAARMADHVVAVGDTHQAIYGFRGADPEAINNLKTRLGNVTELPLSICYRCPKTVIEAAKIIVPHIEASPMAEDGAVETVDLSQFRERVSEGEYVICRTTAPLVTNCLRLISDGVRATVLGRDIGQGLTQLVDNIAMQLHTQDISAFIEGLQQHQSAERARLSKINRDSEIMALDDKCESLIAIAGKCNTTLDMKKWIQDIFSDQGGSGVTFSTVHKAKGLEAPVIYILRPDLMPHPSAKKAWQQMQESNLKYVAITRAMQTLIWVTGA